MGLFNAHNMKKYKKVMVEHTKLEETVCDGCGKPIKVDSPFEVFKAGFTMVEGTVYPEGTHLEETSIDMCQDCVTNALDFLRETLNFNVNMEEVER